MTKATILLLVATLVIPRLQRRSAAERHALWAASLAGAALLPLLSAVLPAWQPEWTIRVASVFPVSIPVAPGDVAASGDITVRATGIESGWTLSALALILWPVGAAIALLWMGAAALRLRQLVSSAHVVPDHDTHRIASEIAGSLAHRNPPLLLQSARISVPIAWGVRRARILLPETSRDWPGERLQAVLTHEMAHIGRGDWIAHLAAEAICAIYWFHPLFWMARNRMCRESERAADDLVLSTGMTGADYAAHLVDIVRIANRLPPPLTPTVAMARRSGLERRVTALLASVINRNPLGRRAAVALPAAASIVVATMAMLSAAPARDSIRVWTSNLPAISAAGSRDVFADDAGDPVSSIRVVDDGDAPDTAPLVEEYTTPPLYSDEARRRGVEGVVRARAVVDSRGVVTAAQIVSGLGFGLDQNAIVALRQWRFRPGTRFGRPSPVEVEVEIPFTLRGEAINAQIANDMVSLVGPGVRPPRAVKVVQLPSRAASVRGTVILDVVLLEDGTPRIVRILRSLDADANERAVRTFEQWRFSPATLDGRPLRVRMNAEVTFHD